MKAHIQHGSLSLRSVCGQSSSQALSVVCWHMDEQILLVSHGTLQKAPFLPLSPLLLPESSCLQLDSWTSAVTSPPFSVKLTLSVRSLMSRSEWLASESKTERYRYILYYWMQTHFYMFYFKIKVKLDVLIITYWLWVLPFRGTDSRFMFAL